MQKKGRDSSEKLFRGDKSYLGDKAERVYGSESIDTKVFIEFVALIIRNRIYACLKAIESSSKFYEEIMKFISGQADQDEE